MNPTSTEINTLQPQWLSDYADIFPKELTKLPPSREVDHAIKLIPGSQPIARRPYKMLVPEAIELKEKLNQLINQGFIRPSVSPWSALVLFNRK